jgi:hypothetical protein
VNASPTTMPITTMSRKVTMALVTIMDGLPQRPSPCRRRGLI